MQFFSKSCGTQCGGLSEFLDLSGDAVKDLIDSSEAWNGYILTLSAKEGEIDSLRTLVESLFLSEELVIGEDAILSSSRQVGALLGVRAFLDTAIAAYRDGFYADCASSDIELAIGALGEVDGKTVSDEVVADIFAKFCVGK